MNRGVLSNIFLLTTKTPRTLRTQRSLLLRVLCALRVFVVNIPLLLILSLESCMADTINLPPPPGADMPLHQAIEERRSRRRFGSGEMTIEQVSELLWSAAGITGSRGKFRAAPSAGATYPIDTYILIEKVAGLEPGIYRYIEGSHSLDLVKSGKFADNLAEAALGQAAIRDASAIICLFGIYERTTARYGDRGRQYVHMEIGHIGQNVYLVAEALGLSTVAIGAFYDEDVSELFDVEGEPLYFLPLGPRAD